jgi:hypothetical protein
MLLRVVKHWKEWDLVGLKLAGHQPLNNGISIETAETAAYKRIRLRQGLDKVLRATLEGRDLQWEGISRLTAQGRVVSLALRMLYLVLRFLPEPPQPPRGPG